MAIDSSEQARDLCRVLVLTDEDMGRVQCEPQLALSTYLAVKGSQMHSDAPVTCQNTPDLSKQSVNSYSPCAVDVDIEKGNSDKVIINDETGGSIKTEIAPTKALRRQYSLQPTGEPKALRRQYSLQPTGEPVQPFMNHILMLLKLDSKDKQAMERAHDAPNNRWRKCKRPSVFDSRQIVLLFSILSSMGTLVLIYLTLRVRQASEGLVQLS